ncbi:hypothetical protein [Antiquaquibacter soli]|uniref:DUF4760 domain-containing protein n=1 Tax=Antiquaquibacter soli TaxID=3064523 RepID=A0ABT9BRR9_9MICO|nr:hypothetical protein [Protaetiibacter sp. WY-16]MDO7883655.1 hypothetical protein [Protaetiibacter sp. WY-16]
METPSWNVPAPVLIADFAIWEMAATVVVTAAVTWLTIYFATRSARNATGAMLEQAERDRLRQRRLDAALAMRQFAEARIAVYENATSKRELAHHMREMTQSEDRLSVLMAGIPDGERMRDVVYAALLEYLDPELTSAEREAPAGFFRSIVDVRLNRRDRLMHYIKVWERDPDSDLIKDLESDASVRFLTADRQLDTWLRIFIEEKRTASSWWRRLLRRMETLMKRRELSGAKPRASA